MEHGSGTHAVFNQTPPLTDYDLYATDPALRDAVWREGAAAAEAELTAAGTELGRADLRQHAQLANRYGPVLQNFNPQGARIDSVEFHPSWHVLLRGITARGYHSSPWLGAPGGHAVR